MRFFRWLYRLPGRITRSFGPTAAAMNMEQPGYGGSQVNAAGVRIVAQEIADATEEETRTDGDGDEEEHRRD